MECVTIYVSIIGHISNFMEFITSEAKGVAKKYFHKT